MPIPASPGPAAPPLAGRDRELRVLRDQLAAARTGQGGLVLIGGEAGIGKTALAEALCHEAAASGALVLTGHCYDLSETPPYGPWRDLFARSHPADRLPPLPMAFGERGTIGAVASAAALFQQVQDFLTAATTRQPLVVLLDDLHWSDPASLDLLRFLARHADALPLLLLVTYRANELTRRHPLYHLLPLLERESHATRLDLRSLTTDAVGTLVTRYHLMESDQARLVAHLQARAEGNAFFLIQLLRALEEGGILRPAEDRWTLGDLAHVQVPMPLRQVIDGRLGRLGEETQRLLAVAAVIGQDVAYAVWATVAGAEEETLAVVIEQGAAAHLIEETPDGAHAQFVHALIRETLYEGMQPSRRRRLHQQIGEALVASINPDPDAMAYHFQQAGDARAAEWLITAGERAQRAYAWATATDRWETALKLLGDDGDARTRATLLYQIARLRRFFNPRQGIDYCEEAERLAREVGDPALIAVARFSRGHCRWYTATELERTLQEMMEGTDLLEALSPSEQARLGCPPDEDGIPTITLCRGQVVLALEARGRLKEALMLGERYVPGTPTMTALGELGRSHLGDRDQALAGAYAMLGRPEEARAAAEKTHAVLRSGGHYANLGAMAFLELQRIILPYFADHIADRRRVAAEGEEAWRLASSGTTDPPRLSWMPVLFVEGAWAESRALAFAEVSGGLTYQREWAMATLGPLARAQGEPEILWPHIRHLLPDGPLTSEENIDFFDLLGLQRLATDLLLDANESEAAREWLEAHDRWLQWSGAVLGQSEGHALWATYHRAAGDTAAAYESATRALQHATEPRQPLALLAAHRLLGALDTDAGRFDDARGHLDASLALADACAAPYERALTLLARAELHTAMEDRADALRLLDEARAICTPLGARPALTRADALTARLSAVKDIAPAYPAGLSAREVEVLRLVVAGQTNREIAAALFLSEHTVRVHVRNILTKTESDNRTEAAAFALRTGIA